MALLRATVISFDATPHTATIRLDGSAAETLTGVRTSRAIASGDMTAGRRTILDTGDHHHPDDFVITAVYTA